MKLIRIRIEFEYNYFQITQQLKGYKMDHLVKAVVFFSLIISAHAATAACTLDVEVGDGLMFNAKELSVEKSCGSITVNLKHTGTMAANIMGHNWVLTSEGDANDVAGKGIAAGLANNYVPTGDARVIAVSYTHLTLPTTPYV